MKFVNRAGHMKLPMQGKEGGEDSGSFGRVGGSCCERGRAGGADRQL